MKADDRTYDLHVIGTKPRPSFAGRNGTYSVLGEGEVQNSGWARVQASLTYFVIERQEPPRDWRTAHFVYARMDKPAAEIHPGFYNLYMRETGFGFGFLYTLASVRGADEAKTPAQLIGVLQQVLEAKG